jgi:hypothetical protein
MSQKMRRVVSAPLATAILLGVSLGAAAFGASASAQVAPCSASIDPSGTVAFGTSQTLTVTGLTPNGAVTITQTHNGTDFPGAGTADSSGGITGTLTYALGTWTDAFHDSTTGAECSVSWTVIEGTPTTTTTTLAPTSGTAPASAITAAPTFTG